MSEVDYLIEDVSRCVNAPKDQRGWNRTSIMERMKSMEQEPLIESLQKMNLKELQYCMGCGIPGSANTEAIKLVRVRQQEFKVFLENQSKKRVELNEKGSKEIHSSVNVSIDDKDAWSENDESDSSGKGLSKALLAFEKGRESDL